MIERVAFKKLISPLFAILKTLLLDTPAALALPLHHAVFFKAVGRFFLVKLVLAGVCFDQCGRPKAAMHA